MLSPQSSDAQTRAENLVEMLLFDTVILAFPGNSQAKQVAVEREATVRVRNNNGGMVNSQEKLGSSGLPLRITFPGRKPDDFEHMVFRILEVKSPDAAGVRIPVRQRLRSGGDVLNLVLSQLLIRLVHVAHHDGDVLKPVIVAARVGRHRLSLHRMLRKGDKLSSQLQADGTPVIFLKVEEIAGRLRVKFAF